MSNASSFFPSFSLFLFSFFFSLRVNEIWRGKNKTRAFAEKEGTEESKQLEWREREREREGERERKKRERATVNCLDKNSKRENALTYGGIKKKGRTGNEIRISFSPCMQIMKHVLFSSVQRQDLIIFAILFRFLFNIKLNSARISLSRD